MTTEQIIVNVRQNILDTLTVILGEPAAVEVMNDASDAEVNVLSKLLGDALSEYFVFKNYSIERRLDIAEMTLPRLTEINGEEAAQELRNVIDMTRELGKALAARKDSLN